MVVLCNLVVNISNFIVIPENGRNNQKPLDKKNLLNMNDNLYNLPKSSSEWIYSALLGECDFYGNKRGFSYDIFVIGNTAYVADGDNGLLIINVSDPTNPMKLGQFNRTIGRFNNSLTFFNNVYVDGDTAYITTGILGGLLIINVSDPTNPTEQAHFSPRFSGPPGFWDPYFYSPVFVSEDIAYTVEKYHGLITVDVSDPTDPTGMAEFGWEGNWDQTYGLYRYDAYNSFVSGDILYLADYNLGLRTIDVRYPTNPRLLSRIQPTQRQALDVFVIGNIAYVGTSEGLEVIDVSDPARMEKLGTYAVSQPDVGYHPTFVHVVDNIAYVVSRGVGLSIIDVSNSINPTKLGQFNNGGHSLNVYSVDNIAYVADGDKGLVIIDVSDPSNPTKLGQFKDGGYDTDGDCLIDSDEINIYLTDPNDSDTDDDLMPDGWEVSNGLNPLVDDSSDDPDTDNLSNLEEYTYSTDPNDLDSDNDGLNDGEEINTYSTDPNDLDSDNDGLNDGEEVNTYSTDPNDPDSDNDDLNDGDEVNRYSTDPNDADSDNDGLNDGDEVGVYGTNPNNRDTDGDGFSDYDEIFTHDTDPNNYFSNPNTIPIVLGVVGIICVIPIMYGSAKVIKKRKRKKKYGIMKTSVGLYDKLTKKLESDLIMEPISDVLVAEEIDDVGIRNQNIISEAKNLLKEGLCNRAIELFQQSKDICIKKEWVDGVRFADKKITECIEQQSKERELIEMKQKLDRESPLSEIELILFLLDGSSSIEEITSSGKSKVEYLIKFIKDLTQKLNQGEFRERYIASIMYFSKEVYVSEYSNNPCIRLDDIEIKNPVKIIGSSKSSLINVLSKANEILNYFYNYSTFPESKFSTIFLITDGINCIDDDGAIIREAEKLKCHPVFPSIATIALGDQSNIILLNNISSEIKDNQLRLLDLHGLLNFLPNKQKMFYIIHDKNPNIKKGADLLKSLVHLIY